MPAFGIMLCSSIQDLQKNHRSVEVSTIQVDQGGHMGLFKLLTN